MNMDMSAIISVAVSIFTIIGVFLAFMYFISSKIDSLDTKLSSKIDSLDTKLSSKIDELDTRLSNKIDAVDTKLSNKIDAVDTKLSNKIDAVDKRLIYIEAGIDFSVKNKPRDIKPVKTRRPRVQKTAQITMKDPV